MANSENTENYEKIPVEQSEASGEDVSGATGQRVDEEATTSKEIENRLNLGSLNDLQPIDFNSADTIRQTVKTLFRGKEPTPYSDKIWRVHNNSESSIVMDVEPFELSGSDYTNSELNTGNRDEFGQDEEALQTIDKEATTSRGQPLNLHSNYKGDNMNDFEPFRFNSADIVRQAIEVFSQKVPPSHSRNVGQDKKDFKNESHMTARRSIPMICSHKEGRQATTVGKQFRNSKKKRTQNRKAISPRSRHKIILAIYEGKLSNFIPYVQK